MKEHLSYKQRIETIKKEFAAIKADIQEIVKPDTLKVGWVYEDTVGDKWIIFRRDSDSNLPFAAISLHHASLNYFSKTGKNFSDDSEWDLILSTGRKLEL